MFGCSVEPLPTSTTLITGGLEGSYPKPGLLMFTDCMPPFASNLTEPTEADAPGVVPSPTNTLTFASDE